MRVPRDRAWRVAWLGITVSMVLAACAEGRLGDRYQARVVAVHDGDTVTVLRGREQVRVRLWGIDAPERGQPYGTRSRRELAGLVFQRTVTVMVLDADDYGRSVARLTVDGIAVNQEMVRRGMAWWYRRFAHGAQDLAQAEAEARAARRGLWAEAEPVAPWEHRRRHTPASP